MPSLQDEEGRAAATQTAAQLPQTQQEQLAAYREAANRRRAAQQDKLQAKLLDSYQDYAARRLAIEAQYNADLSALQTQQQQAGEIGDTVNEAVTQTSFDSLRNSFLDALMDMDKSAEDFASDIERYMQKAILNGMVTDKFDSQLNAWYKDWVAKSQGGMTADEYNALKAAYDKIVQGAITDRDSLNDLFGWGDTTAPDRTAQAKGIASMSQDSANQLNGNFNALLIYQEKTSTGVTNINTLLVEGLGLLSRIATNTDRLEAMESDLKSMRVDFRSIINNGLKLRKQ